MDQRYLTYPDLPGRSFFWRRGSKGILLLHGATATTHEVRQLALDFAKQGYTVYAPLLPGHGTSPQQLNQVSVDDTLAFVQQAYETLARQCTAVCVAGESMGALLALYLAATNPEIESVMAYSPVLKLVGADTLWQRMKVIVASWMLTSVAKPDLTQDHAHQVYRVRPMQAMVALLDFQQRVFAVLPTIQQPVLLIEGQADNLLAPGSVMELCEALSQSMLTYHSVPSGAHVLLLGKDWPLVRQLTHDFMDSLRLKNIA